MIANWIDALSDLPPAVALFGKITAWFAAAFLAGSLALAGLGGLRLTYAAEIAGVRSAPGPFASTPAGNPEAGRRVLHFPKDRSLGRLSVQDADAVRNIETFYDWIDGTKWEYLGPAQGDVAVPAGKRLRLTVSADAFKDLSPLSQLGPDDLYGLSFAMSLPGGPTANDGCMPHVARLTGLKELGLRGMRITDNGMRHVTNLKGLTRLDLPEAITNRGLAYAAQLPSLKQLHFGQNKITNAGLSQLARLTGLEELELGGEFIGDAALVHLAGLRSLRYLMLWQPQQPPGRRFTGAGLVHLKKVPSLHTLALFRMNTITDDGMAAVATLPKLERLFLYDNQQISDQGMAYLKTAPSLKMLDVGATRVTDNGLAHLKEIKTLELLKLPERSLTDQGLASLSELTKLKQLSLLMPYYLDAKNYKNYYTEKGLADLAKLQSLEELSIAGPGATNAALAHVAKLTKLKDLMLFGCPITNEGLAQLASLKDLRKLDLSDCRKLTLGGLSQLNALPRLTVVNAHLIIHDDAKLDLSKLTELEEIALGMPLPKGDPKAAVHDEDLACLAPLKRLRWLQVWPGDISDAGMAHLAGLTNLERLSIGGDRLTDKGLAQLANMSKLDLLNIKGDFTDDGLRRLEGLKALSHLEITSKGAFSKAALERLRTNLPSLGILKVVP